MVARIGRRNCAKNQVAAGRRGFPNLVGEFVEATALKTEEQDMATAASKQLIHE